ncbi:von Willebrand factor D and EGF domain-containing protein-like, partial [Saccostrea cucullata]|uniref:von Willebrand factor D and EGF domain-containing protein-like n=1 Tax=Saccostrea cuccullata TaxID=36930 RepID=UPI002ED074FC
MKTLCCNPFAHSSSAIRIIFLCFLISLVTGQEHREIPLTCASNWTQYDRNCYRLYTSVKDWIGAYRYCQLEDSILVDIASESEQNFLQDFVNGRDVWIGASSIFVNGQWLWYGSHQYWNYTNWNTNEPDNAGSVEICTTLDNEGKWSDRDCGQQRAFVCKQRTFLSFCDSSWAVKDGHCYKHFTKQFTWTTAMKSCQGKKAVLVSIQNSAEQSFMNGLYTGDEFWIGGFDRHREGTWSWSGTTLLFSNTYWMSGQPNNGGNQDCLTSLKGSGLWNDRKCHEKRTYMCQRNTFHLDKDPVLTFEVNETTQETSLLCDFDTNFTDIEFLVNWYFNSDMIKEEIVTINKTESLLEETQIPPLLFGDQIKCSVTPCMPGNCFGFRGSPRNSKIFIAKVQVESGTQITVHERSGPVIINVTSTIPPRLFCYKELRANACKVEITTELVKGREFKCRGFPVSQAVFGMDNLQTKPCSHMINKDNWQSGVLISVKASIDSLRDRNQRRNIRLSLKTPNNTKEISTVQVTVIDGDKVALCSSINDPHMATFDKKYYDVYLEGEFILYRHRTLPYEVRTFYRRCNRVAACNCAVAIRSGDDVILFDVCGPSMGKSSRRTRYTMKMYLNGDLTPGTDVIRKGGGKTYEVILPTGAVVYVMTGNGFFNVKMLASALDYKNTEGLCGNFDGDRNNDFRKRDGELYTRGGKQPNEFSLSWRVPEEDSLYRGYCESSADTSPKVENYCDCLAGKTAACQEGMDKMTCVEIQKRKGLLGNRRTKLVTLDLIKDAESPPARCQSIRPPEPFGYVPNYTQPDPVWPTPGNITEDEARKFCQGFIEAKESGKKCASLPGLDLTPIVQGCITDLQLTDDKSWASESFDNLQQECTTIVEGDPDQWTVNNETGDSIPPPEIVGVICPNSCTENGNCTDGLCQCFHPWIGDDCSINSTAPPDLFEIGNGEPCDSICTNCTTVNLYGDNFADVENLTCHYRSLGINMQAVSASTSKAEFLNSQTVKCAFPNDGLYEVAVSNDGQTTSLYTIYIIYNSHCHQCTSSGCTVRTDVCRIGGVCFVHGFVNPQNVLEVCDISVSNNGWSTLQVEKISTKRYNFQNIIGQYLVTSSDNVVIGGTGTPTLTTGVSGGTAVILDGRQYLAFGDLTNVCFGDIAKSSLGITITFNVRLMTNTHTCFLLSNGGDDDQYYGYAIWFGNNRLYARVSNKWSEWVTSMSSVKLEEFMTVEMSWSLQFGLQLSVDQEVKASTRKCISRLTSNYTVFKDFIVGGSSKKEQNCQMMIETITFVCAGKDIINSTGLKFKDPEVPGQCVVSLRLEATAAVISTSVIAGTLFCITCIFCILCG